jgi:uroporphyrinogen decarboxylase
MAHGDSTMGIPDGESMAEFAADLFDNRDKILEEQERRLDAVLKRGEELMAAGVDGFILCCDYCFNSGPFLSPNMFGEFVTPFLKRLVAGYRRMGAYAIKHTDGDIMPILDQLVECEPHGLHSIDSMAGVDIAEVKRLYGDRICLMGNVNCATMQTGTDEEILESCRYAMENGKMGGGYIFSTSNCIFRGVPTRAYDLMIDYWRKNREY